MAIKTLVTIESDLSGKSPAETVNFSWNGFHYEIDLTEEEKEEAGKAFEELIKVSRVKGKKPSGKARPARSNLEASPATVREWARSQGLDVPKRGRIPAEIFEKFAQAEKGESQEGSESINETEVNVETSEKPAKAARKKAADKKPAEKPVASEAQFSAAE